MVLTRSYLVSLLLYISVVNEIRLPQVTCQDEEVSQCIPKMAFIALLRLPEVSSNLAAYSRTAKIIQDVKNRNDMAHLKALTEEGDDAEICIPIGIYLEMFRDPALRGHLSVIGRTQKVPNFPGRLFDDSEEVDSGDFVPEAQKRSIAMLAKNDDLPILPIQDRMENEDDEEKRSIQYSGEQSRRNGAEIPREYLLPNGELDLEAVARDFPMDKRNVASLARDFALPPGKRNVAALARDYGLPSGKRNIGALARDYMLPSTGKRNVASLARTYMLPQNSKKNIGSLARDFALPYGKRYIGSLARAGLLHTESKRNVASLVKNSDWPGSSKRGVSAPGSLILKTLSRYGRSLADEVNTKNEPLGLQTLHDQNDGKRDNDSYQVEELQNQLARNRLNRRIDSLDANERRSKRQIDFSDEYPLPVMQNANILDYEEMLDALTEQYPNAEKRFMGSAPVMQSDVPESGYPDVFRASKRHIAALARLGWLPSLRAPRFSRSPRYLVDRENSADGAPSDYASHTSTRSLRPNFKPRTRYLQALHGDCRHGFKRFTLLPAVDNVLRQQLPNSPRSI